MAVAAVACKFGTQWVHTSRVRLIVACPSRSLTTLPGVPWARCRVAAVCRKWWKRITDTPTAFPNFLNRGVICQSINGLPVSTVKTR